MEERERERPDGFAPSLLGFAGCGASCRWACRPVTIPFFPASLSLKTNGGQTHKAGRERSLLHTVPEQYRSGSSHIKFGSVSFTKPESPVDEAAAMKLFVENSPAAEDSGVVPMATRQLEGFALCLGSGSVDEKLC